MAQKTDVLLPDIGDFKDVEIIEILVKPGDRVEAEDPLITLESDKASMEIPAPQAGVVVEVRVAVGDKVNEGDPILTLDADAGQAAAEAADEDRAEAAEHVEDIAAPAERGDAAAPAAAPPVAEPAAAGPVEAREVRVPDIGDFKGVEVIEVLVGVGDRVDAEQSLLTLESDKASMEIPAPFAGTVSAIAVKVGDRVSEGDLIGSIDAAGETADAPAAAPAAAAAPVASPTPAIEAETPRPAGEKEQLRPPVMARPDDAVRQRAHASPAVRRFARQLGVNLSLVAGSAPKNRIIKEDVQAFVKRALAEGAPAAPGVGGGVALPAVPAVDFSKFGPIEEQALGRIKKLSGAHLHRSWLNVPHVTQFDEADITELEAFRKAQKDAAAKADVKLTFMPFLMKAVCKALATYPQFNSSLSADGEKLVMKKYVHIGVAVDTPNGLVVPVVRDVDQKGIFELAADLGEMSAKARAGKLAPGDMQGGCISISSLGGIGGIQFTPIVNAPEVAILGISRAEMKPKWDGKVFEPRLMMPFSLSYDHRVIDGAEGVRFTTHLAELLGDIRRLLL
ncbi:MAG: dihydrolipoyllysine-residue acetyltransferase [Chromatiaceae bacterium]|nr:dihydrolipoyllysine-residue acetyltransferase [Gammaproteobacteria bacterium]MCP5301418.1 dihydrolipoyllysine-residue acetyltransferase [Chromatiaceae bacterium]MCP5306683.1 dihydrolipoyllysine-residue acetyltransferase [Chromatiaceae bacterium]MCP5421815.1 dihydrolipoyllysine-residue acetyltransferase [Chromatiaceae bacterium]